MADTPFGLSFGNPSKYMGQSPLAEVGKAIKTGLVGYGIQKSGLESWLNEKGMSKNKQGGYEYKPPTGAIAPPQAAMGAPVSPPQMQAMQPMNPGNPAGVTVSPVPEVNFAPPVDIGDKILNDDWYEPISDLSNPTDFNPSMQQTGYNQMLQTGNEYQQIPGYGKLDKTAQAMFGMG
jgi:hypothetical protein